MNQLSISQAREQLTRLPYRLRQDPEPIEVTTRGKPVLAILPWDLYESMEETIEILGDDQLMASLRKSLEELRRRKGVPWDAVKKDLRLK